MLTVAEYEDLASTILEKYEYPLRTASIRISKRLRESIAYNDISKKTITLSHDWFDCNGADFAVYILKHEIAHFKYPDHSPAFKRECLKMGIRARATLKPKDFVNHGWHVPVGMKCNGVVSRWVPRQYCRYQDCEALV
jgi:predicted metal-dependent hydrolase